MIYLLLAILSSAAIPIIFKFAHTKRLNEAIVITLNYLTISIVMGSRLIMSGEFSDWSDPVKLQAVYIGLVSGFFFYIGFFLYQRSVRACGATMAGAFGKIGILIPATLSLLLWKEYPTNLQWVGIVIAVIAIFVAVIDFKTFKIANVHAILLVFFVVGGLGDFSTKVFEVYNDIGNMSVFLFFNFFTALLWSLPGALKSGIPGKWDVGIGALIGIPNLLASFFLVLAMTQVAGVIVFPLFSGGTVVMVSIFSRLLFKEKLSLKGYVAIGMIIFALAIIQ